jgi:carboxymethylenebutenolidase
MGQMITIRRPNGGNLEAYSSEIDPARPSVIVLQEWWGLNDHIKAKVDMFDADGFNALAPDLYHGRVTKDANEASHMMNGLDFQGAVHEDIAASVLHLRTINESVGIMGYCMGGALTIASAVRLKGLRAAVCFYGVPPLEFADPIEIAIPFQAHFANRDDWVTQDVAFEVISRMKAAGLMPEVYHYEADHAFCNVTRPEVYNEDLAELAWERMIDFLGDNL